LAGHDAIQQAFCLIGAETNSQRQKLLLHIATRAA
jgi:hypothetical protein